MATSSDLKVIVVGGGIGGLTAGIALRRAGIQAEVYERAASLDQMRVGAGTHLWSNAMRILQKLGVAEQIEDTASVVECTEFWSASGKLLARWEIGALGRELGVPSVGVVRSEVARVLLAAFDADALHLGAECTGFAADSTGVTAHFKDGREARGDVLIGADGMNSAVRAQLLGGGDPDYSGWTFWQGINTAHTELCPPGIHRILTGAGAKFIFHHAGGDRLCWLAMVNAPAGRIDPDGDRRMEALGQIRGWMEPAERIVETTDPKAIRHADMYHRKTERRWGEGRVTMLGDAVHAMTSHVGQGACQAIEDAYTIAACLQRTSDPVAALRTYEQQRRQRASGVAMTAWRIGQIQSVRKPVIRSMRDQMFKAMLVSVANRSNTKLLSFEI